MAVGDLSSDNIQEKLDAAKTKKEQAEIAKKGHEKGLTIEVPAMDGQGTEKQDPLIYWARKDIKNVFHLVKKDIKIDKENPLIFFFKENATVPGMVSKTTVREGKTQKTAKEMIGNKSIIPAMISDSTTIVVGKKEMTAREYFTHMRDTNEEFKGVYDTYQTKMIELTNIPLREVAEEQAQEEKKDAVIEETLHEAEEMGAARERAASASEAQNEKAPEPATEPEPTGFVEDGKEVPPPPVQEGDPDPKDFDAILNDLETGMEGFAAEYEEPEKASEEPEKKPDPFAEMEAGLKETEKAMNVKAGETTKFSPEQAEALKEQNTATQEQKEQDIADVIREEFIFDEPSTPTGPARARTGSAPEAKTTSQELKPDEPARARAQSTPLTKEELDEIESSPFADLQTTAEKQDMEILDKNLESLSKLIEPEKQPEKPKEVEKEKGFFGKLVDKVNKWATFKSKDTKEEVTKPEQEAPAKDEKKQDEGEKLDKGTKDKTSPSTDYKPKEEVGTLRADKDRHQSQSSAQAKQSFKGGVIAVIAVVAVVAFPPAAPLGIAVAAASSLYALVKGIGASVNKGKANSEQSQINKAEAAERQLASKTKTVEQEKGKETQEKDKPATELTPAAKQAAESLKESGSEVKSEKEEGPAVKRLSTQVAKEQQEGKGQGRS